MEISMDQVDAAQATLVVSNVSKNQILLLEEKLSPSDQKKLHDELLISLKNLKTIPAAPLPAHLMKVDRVANNVTFSYEVDAAGDDHHMVFITIRHGENNQRDISLAASPIKLKDQLTPWHWVFLLIILAGLFALRRWARRRRLHSSL